MLRRSLFCGLTVVLIAVLVSLILQGRRLEKAQARKPIAVIHDYKASATRVLAPAELEITSDTMKVTGNTAHHQIDIRNNGKFPYREIQLKIFYVDNSGKILAVRTHLVTETIKPGAALKIADLDIGNVPDSAAGFRVCITSADMMS
jgi:hypothetical protein